MPSPLVVPEITDPRGRALVGLVARDAYYRRLQAEVAAVLDAAFREVARDILTAGDSLTPAARQRLALLYTTIERRLEQAYGTVATDTARSLASYSRVEVDAAAAEVLAQVRDAGGLLPATTTFAVTPQTEAAIAALPIEGLPFGDWWQRQAENVSLATRRTLQVGLLRGEGAQQLAARIVPPRDSVAPAVWRQARQQAFTLVRTTTTAVHAEAAFASYVAVGRDVTGEYELVTARDARVSKICAALDGQVFRYDDPNRKVPPFHPACRTIIVPRLNTRALGIKTPPRQPPYTFPSYDNWLRAQSATTQDAVLGPTRGDWYRQGKLGLRDLVDRDNRVLTLAQLRARLGAPQDVAAD